jgi:hypothetical protein
VTLFEDHFTENVNKYLILEATDDTQYQGKVPVLPAAGYLVKKCSYLCMQTVQ